MISSQGPWPLDHEAGHADSSTTLYYKGVDKSLSRPGRKQSNVSDRMLWISFGTLPCRGKKNWWQLASRYCWNRARPWHPSGLVSFLVGLRTYQHPVVHFLFVKTNKYTENAIRRSERRFLTAARDFSLLRNVRTSPEPEVLSEKGVSMTPISF